MRVHGGTGATRIAHLTDMHTGTLRVRIGGEGHDLSNRGVSGAVFQDLAQIMPLEGCLLWDDTVLRGASDDQLA
jgi:hypothetical protein